MKKRGLDLAKLDAIVGALQTDAPLPPSARPHKLVSQAREIWDVHIANDWVLLYEINDEALIMHRTGSHSDLFN